MKKLKTSTWLFIFALNAAFLAACAPSGGDSQPAAPPPSVIGPAGSRIGFFAQNTRMTEFNGDAQGSTYTISNSAGATTFYQRVLGLCDRDSGTSCSDWIDGFQDVIVIADGAKASNVKLVFRASPYNPFNPVTVALNGTINLINDSQGFEIRAQAPAIAELHGGAGRLIHFRVESGKFENPTWDFKIYLDYDPSGQLVSTGRATRCQTQNCGVPGL